MKVLEKAITNLVKCNAYDFEFGRHKLYLFGLLFLKATSDVVGMRMYEECILPLAGEKNIGAEIDIIVKNLTALEDVKIPKYEGVCDGLLSKFIKTFSEFDLDDVRYRDEDIFTCVYQALSFACFKGSANPKNGEYITPPFISRMMSQMISQPKDDKDKKYNAEGKEIITVYDPCCGTGLLLADFIRANPDKEVHTYGQDINHDMCAITSMNLKFEYIRRDRKRIEDQRKMFEFLDRNPQSAKMLSIIKQIQDNE